MGKNKMMLRCHLKAAVLSLSVLVLPALAVPPIHSQTQAAGKTHPAYTHQDTSDIAAFEEKFEALRERHHIPGFSAGVVHGRELIWKQGFGFADLENKIVPDENTVYQVAKVIEKASGRTFGELLIEKVIVPLGLRNTTPSTDDSAAFSLTGYDRDVFLRKVARPYDWAGGELKPVKFTYGFGPAAGLMSNVSDLARYSVAIDDRKILNPATWEHVFTPFVTPKGKTLQYGLGWFVTYHKGIKMMWHTGWWTGYSALLVKIPERDLTFIILANSQDLSRPFYHIVRPLPLIGFRNPLRASLDRKLTASDFAEVFIDYFVKQ